MFLPTTKQELIALGWDCPDVVLVSGDVYIDSPYDGVAIIGKVLLDAGYRVGIISQPDVNSADDIMRLGEPKLFWGISSGVCDSMVANYTALMKRKRNDDLTPGGVNDKRPDRAVIAYTNLIKKYYKNAKPIVLGGVEASLRRVAHYDYWDNKIRRSVLFDSKADAIVYGMGEKTILELAEHFKKGTDFLSTRGICYVAKEAPEKFKELPPFESVRDDKVQFIDMFNLFYKNNDPLNADGLYQKHGDRYLVQNPPNAHLTKEEFDNISELEYERDVHPFYKKQGKVKALDTIQFSINSHRGCWGECNFCSITVHQGRKIISRSEKSILREAETISKHRGFKGYISDVGGPTANMFGMSCNIQNKAGSCKNKRCVTDKVCQYMDIRHKPQLDLLAELRKIPGIKKVFIGSGIRYDLVVQDSGEGTAYIAAVAGHHVSGQLKIAPEHIDNKVLRLMGKPSAADLKKFIAAFNAESKRQGKNQFLTYYFIAAHPGCDFEQMEELRAFIRRELKFDPEQVQIFTPTPSTYSSLMYYTGLDPFTKEPVFVERELRRKSEQKKVVFD